MSRSARHSWQLKLLSTTFALPRYHMSAQGRGTEKGSDVSNEHSNEAAVINEDRIFSKCRYRTAAGRQFC